MPLPEIRTARLLLRSFQSGDAADLKALWTTPEVRRYLWDDVIIDEATVQQVLESHLDTENRLGIGFWTMAFLHEQPIVGFCGFRPMDGGEEIELLYGMRGEHWGKGLAFEACAAVLEYLWRQTAYPRVFARTDPPNHRSVRLMERLGMNHKSTTSQLVTYWIPRPVGFRVRLDAIIGR